MHALSCRGILTKCKRPSLLGSNYVATGFDLEDKSQVLGTEVLLFVCLFVSYRDLAYGPGWFQTFDHSLQSPGC